MERRSHDSSRPKTPQLGAHFRDRNCYAQRASARAEPRERIDYHSADCVTLRLAEAGRTAGLRGAVAEVLEAVITMLPRHWSKIRDTELRLRQLVELCPSRPHQRTVGRALRRLDDLDIISYVPARGRGATATITVHHRFLEGVEELERDESGSVLVPFSRPYTSLFPKGKPQQRDLESAPESALGPRPVEVPVSRAALSGVLDHLPAMFSDLPRNLRWLLGRAVRDKLARGYRPEDIVDVLAAPTPADLQRPFKLAIWRLTQNMAGPGPNLRPLQRRWDQEQRAAQERTRLRGLAEDYRRIKSATTARQRDQLLAAGEELFGPAEDPRTVVVTAARRAGRQYPGVPTAAAIAAWLDNGDQRLTPRYAPPSPAEASLTGDLPMEGLKWLTGDHSGTCIGDGCSRPGLLRKDLPIPIVACGQCLERAAAGDEDDQSLAAA